MSNRYSFSLPSNSLILVDRPDTRTVSPIAFFRDHTTGSDIDLRVNLMDAERRAQAIATAPRRNRYDDDDADRVLSKSCITASIPIPIPTKKPNTASTMDSFSASSTEFHDRRF